MLTTTDVELLALRDARNEELPPQQAALEAGSPLQQQQGNWGPSCQIQEISKETSSDGQSAGNGCVCVCVCKTD